MKNFSPKTFLFHLFPDFGSQKSDFKDSTYIA